VHLGDWVAAGGGGGGLLVGADLLVFIRMLIFLTSEKNGGYHQNAKMDTVHIKDGSPLIGVQQLRSW
jgi:hypothetical protein